MAATMAAHVAVTIVGAFQLRELYRWDPTNLRFNLVRLFRHGKYALASRMGSSLHKAADNLVGGGSGGSGSGRLYGTARKLADYVELPLQSVVKVLVPTHPMRPDSRQEHRHSHSCTGSDRPGASWP
jgi:hypothetical protein